MVSSKKQGGVTSVAPRGIWRAAREHGGITYQRSGRLRFAERCARGVTLRAVFRRRSSLLRTPLRITSGRSVVDRSVASGARCSVLAAACRQHLRQQYQDAWAKTVRGQ